MGWDYWWENQVNKQTKKTPGNINFWFTLYKLYFYINELAHNRVLPKN